MPVVSTPCCDNVVYLQCCEKLGAGEILLNCVDMDGQKAGFDLGLIKVGDGIVSICSGFRGGVVATLWASPSSLE